MGEGVSIELLVKQVMTREVVTIKPRSSLEQALWLMNDRRVHRLPVVTQGKLVGLVVQHDIERAMRCPHLILKSPVEWVMTRNLITICPQAPLAQAAQMMNTWRIGCLPVVEDQTLIGILGTSDLLKVLVELLQSPVLR